MTGREDVLVALENILTERQAAESRACYWQEVFNHFGLPVMITVADTGNGGRHFEVEGNYVPKRIAEELIVEINTYSQHGVSLKVILDNFVKMHELTIIKDNQKKARGSVLV